MVTIKKAPAGVKNILDKRGVTKVLPKKTPAPATADASVLAFAFGTAYLVGAADGELTDEEYDTLGQLLADITELEISAEMLDELLEEANSGIEAKGFEGAIEELAAAHTDPKLRRAAFTLAAAVGCADGELGDDELTFHAIADAYEIDEAEANSILDECAEAYDAG